MINFKEGYAAGIRPCCVNFTVYSARLCNAVYVYSRICLWIEYDAKQRKLILWLYRHPAKTQPHCHETASGAVLHDEPNHNQHICSTQY